MDTWGTQVPKGHIAFYSDQPDHRLPVVALSNVTTYDDAQDRFTYLIMPHALARMEALSCNWLVWLDDDTWVWPENLLNLLAAYDATKWIWLGQKCPRLRGRLAFCGGAGFAMSYPLVAAGACISPACTADARVEVPYDRRMGVCFEKLLGVRVIDRIEFNSQPPQYYETETGKKDRPKGYGPAVTFHYLKSQSRLYISPEQHYSALWDITRAHHASTKYKKRSAKKIRDQATDKREDAYIPKQELEDERKRIEMSDIRTAAAVRMRQQAQRSADRARRNIQGSGKPSSQRKAAMKRMSNNEKFRRRVKRPAPQPLGGG